MVVHGDEHKDNSWELRLNKVPVHDDTADYPPGYNLKLRSHSGNVTQKVSSAHDTDVPPWVWVAAAALVVALLVRRRRRRA